VRDLGGPKSAAGEVSVSTTTGSAFERLYGIVRHLRGPQGCAWDQKQTTSSLRSSLLEEACECLDAIDRGDAENLCEELGDLCLVVSMIAIIEQETGRFSLAQALEGVCEKLIRRHPHVFGEKRESDVGRILEQWHRIKQTENGGTARKSALDGVPASLPPLERAYGIQARAAKVGFDWPEAAPVFDKVQEEIGEIQGAKDQSAVDEEVGDLLFTVVNLARLLHVDPARALAASNRKFEIRFREMERRLSEAGREWKNLDLAAMDEVWNEIKAGR
jgi:tetrapyrrole methylase family protein / MazG family protein